MNPTAGMILIADDEPQNIELVTRVMDRLGFDVVSAPDGARALDVVRQGVPDVVVLDINMPKVNGIEVCRSIKNDPATWFTPVILLTGLSEVEDRVRGLDAGADDFLTKPFVVAELAARVRALMKARRHTDALDSAESVILGLGSTIEARDGATRGHCQRLASLASALGAYMGLGPEQCTTLYHGGFLHDVGKVGIPDAILLKAGVLTVDERRIMERHTTIGDTLCSAFRSLGEVRQIVRHHHERLDGSGYPDRLTGERIPRLAQIINIVDAFDAITTARPYRTALSEQHAFDELREEARRGWKDAGLVEQFVEMMHSRKGK